MISAGDVLDKIKAEIEEAQNSAFITLEKYEGLRTALKIIDKYKQDSVFDKIRNEFIDRYPRNYANELELGGRSCVFSLNEILQIIDKYNAPTIIEADKETDDYYRGVQEEY